VIHPLECRQYRAKPSTGEDRPGSTPSWLKRGVLWGLAALGNGAIAAIGAECRRVAEEDAKRPNSGARVPGRGTHAHRQPNEGHPGPGWGIRNFKTNPAPRRAERLATVHTPGGASAPAAKCIGRAAGATWRRAWGFVVSQIRGDRGSSSETIRAGD